MDTFYSRYSCSKIDIKISILLRLLRLQSFVVMCDIKIVKLLNY